MFHLFDSLTVTDGPSLWSLFLLPVCYLEMSIVPDPLVPRRQYQSLALLIAQIFLFFWWWWWWGFTTSPPPADGTLGNLYYQPVLCTSIILRISDITFLPISDTPILSKHNIFENKYQPILIYDKCVTVQLTVKYLNLCPPGGQRNTKASRNGEFVVVILI